MYNKGSIWMAKVNKLINMLKGGVVKNSLPSLQKIIMRQGQIKNF